MSPHWIIANARFVVSGKNRAVYDHGNQSLFIEEDDGVVVNLVVIWCLFGSWQLLILLLFVVDS